MGAGTKRGRRVGGCKGTCSNENTHISGEAQERTAPGIEGGVDCVAGRVASKIRDSRGSAGIKIPHGNHRSRGTGEGSKHRTQVHQRRGLHRIQASFPETCAVGAGQGRCIHGHEVQGVHAPADLDSQGGRGGVVPQHLSRGVKEQELALVGGRGGAGVL